MAITGGFRSSTLDSGNSTTTPLGAGATFTGSGKDALRYASVSVIINTDAPGTLFIDNCSALGQADHTHKHTLSVSAVTGEASSVTTLPVNARFILVRYTNGPTAQTHFRLQTVLQAVPLVVANHPAIDGNNATSTALGSSATFTGTYTDVTSFAEMTLIFTKDTTSSCTLHMDLSVDGSIANRTKTVTYDTGTDGGAHTLVIISRFFRIRIVNDSVAMTDLVVQVILHPQKSKDLTSTMIQDVSNRDDVTLVRDPTIATWDLARKFYEGKSVSFLFGNNKSVGTSWEDIWPNGGDYPFQTTASIVEAVSLDANDSGHSTGTLTLAAQPANGDTFTMGTRTYTFETTLTNVDGNIHIGASAAGTVLNIVDAILLGSSGEGVGVGYATAMTISTTVSAVDGVGDTVDFTSLDTYPEANDGNVEILPTTETGSNLSFAAVAMVHPPGCHAVEIRGLDGTGKDQREIITMHGTTVSLSTKSYLRINKVHIETVGTRGGSNYDDISIQVTGGGDVLAVIKGLETSGTATYGLGEAALGLFTVPLGKVLYINQFDINIATSKTVDMALYAVDDCLDTASSFQARRCLWLATQMDGGKNIRLTFPSLVKVKALTDIFFRAKATSGAANEVEVKCQYWLADINASGR